MPRHPNILIDASLRPLFWLLISCSLLAAGTVSAATCRVSPSGSGNGSSWGQAASLQGALNNSACTEVWVKKGIYKPGAARADVFSIAPGVKVYGGFAGNEAARSQRNFTANLTTLSGDIGTANDASDNSYHVVVMDGTTSAGIITSSTVLDGFTVNGAMADGPFPNSTGGGLYCNGRGVGSECSPTVSNAIFDGNNAGNGGGMYNDAGYGGISSPTLSHVTFSNNTAGFNGGGMFNLATVQGVSSPSLNFVAFIGNTAGAGGGAMTSKATGQNTSDLPDTISSPSLKNVTFSGNNGGLNGGAMLNLASGLVGISEPSLSNVTFNDNYGSNGGAMYNQSESASSPTLSNVTFSSNTAFNGGAIYNYSAGTSSNSPDLSNVTFSNNSATQRGGAIYNYNSLSGAAPVSPILNNVIAWGDSAGVEGAEIYNKGDTTTTINDSVVQGGCPSGGGTTCSNVIAADPHLGTLQDNGGFTETHLPGAGSSAIDAGNDSVCAAAPVNGLDQRGVARPQGPYCDIGSVEATIDLIFRNGFDLP